MNEVKESNSLTRLWNVAGQAWDYNQVKIPPEPEEPKEGEAPAEQQVLSIARVSVTEEAPTEEAPVYPPAECGCKCECSCDCQPEEPPVEGDKYKGCKCVERRENPEIEGVPPCDCDCPCVKPPEPEAPTEPPTRIPHGFRGLNNGELPDPETFVTVSELLTGEHGAVFEGSDGRAYVAGDVQGFEDNVEAEAGMWPRLAELVPNVQAAEEALINMRALETNSPFSPSSIKEIHSVTHLRWNILWGWMDEGIAYHYTELKDGTIFLNGYIPGEGLPNGEEFRGLATDLDGNTLQGIVKTLSYRTRISGRWHVPLLVDSAGGLWAPPHEWNGLNFQKLSDGVTDIIQEEADSLLVLKEGHIYRVRNLSATTFEPERSDGLIWRKISGEKIFQKLYGNHRATALSEVYNVFAIEPDGTMWIKGTNQGGTLGLKGEEVLFFTRVPTASKVEHVIARDSFTFIKKRE